MRSTSYEVIIGLEPTMTLAETMTCNVIRCHVCMGSCVTGGGLV